MRPEELRVLSDWWEPYDHHFAPRWRTDLSAWERQSTTWRTRRADHLLLQRVGLCTPRVGALAHFDAGEDVVAYTTATAHRGEGKVRGMAGDLGHLPDDTWCSEWVGQPGRSRRVLGCGRLFYFLDYVSDDWRSNCGGVTVDLHEVQTEEDARHMSAVGALQARLRAPLVAVDFVRADPESRWLAIDLNTAPGIRGTRAEDDLRDVAESIAVRWAEVAS